MQIFVYVILSFFMRFICRIGVVFGRECSRVKNPSLLQKRGFGAFRDDDLGFVYATFFVSS